MASQAATVFSMPAMSPTMDQGGIVKWHFKEGDAYSAGDSLLEVETDKATIDVEAQDDGILAKIIIQEGVKDIPVGKPIAVTAEPGDDLATLEMPKIEEEPKKEVTKEEPKKEEPKPEPKQETSAKKHTESFGKQANPDQKFFPSVEILLHENNISREDALSKIEASAPNGRITKGDVLAFLGKIPRDSVDSITSYIESNKHLDLSNIVLKAPEETAKPTTKESVKPTKPEPVKVSKTFILSQPISRDQLSQIVTKATKLSEQFSYSSPLYQTSDLVDPIFEDLVAPPHNTQRFQIKVKINEPLTLQKPLSHSEDIFDYLTSSNSSSAISTSSATALPSVDVDLIINDKVVDAKQRAELFVAKFGELLTLPPKNETVEEFEF